MWLDLVHWVVIIWIVSIPLHPNIIFWWSKYTVFILYMLWFAFSGKCPLSIIATEDHINKKGFIYNQLKDTLYPFTPVWFWEYFTPYRFNVLANFILACIMFSIGLRIGQN